VVGSRTLYLEVRKDEVDGVAVCYTCLSFFQRMDLAVGGLFEAELSTLEVGEIMS
jgi:hypothetical protein